MMAKMKGDGSYQLLFTYFKFLINKLGVATFKTADVIEPYFKTKEMLIIEMTTTAQKGIRTYEQVDF